MAKLGNMERANYLILKYLDPKIVQVLNKFIEGHGRISKSR